MPIGISYGLISFGEGRVFAVGVRSKQASILRHFPHCPRLRWTTPQPAPKCATPPVSDTLRIDLITDAVAILTLPSVTSNNKPE